MSYIQFENIHKSFGSNEVLKEINLSVERGQLVTLLGPSGCGKSTLLRCLAGLEDVTAGKIYLDDEDITGKSPKERKIGMVFQQYSLFPNLDVSENIAFGLKMKKMPRNKIEQRVKEMVKMVDLEGKERQYPHQLSGGAAAACCSGTFHCDGAARAFAG
ncbi:MAG TPA: ABC transporter ATP-binding protein [Caproiciproducens sp.]|nr:ABC transporter ATP-binding protein [Caproiciproducens sp.]